MVQGFLLFKAFRTWHVNIYDFQFVFICNRSEGFWTKMKNKITGQQTAHSGHFEIVNKDGSVTPVHSEGQNCLYHAVVQATGANPSELEQKAADLRNVVKNSVSLFPGRNNHHVLESKINSYYRY